MSLNIGYDAKRLFNNFTGLGNYSRDLVSNMATFYPDNNYRLYSPSINIKGIERFNQTIVNQTNNIQYCTPQSIYKHLPSLWRSKTIVSDLKHDKIELYHGLSHELPIGINHTHIKTIVTIHDLIYLRYPQLFPYIDRQIYDAKFKHACKVADKIIAISQCTKNDIIKQFNTDPDKIEVIYQNCNNIFQITASDELKSTIKQRYKLPDDYILYVGSIEERKNLLLLLQAVKTMGQAAIPIVVVGKPTSYMHKVNQYITENNLADKVSIYHSIPFADLPVIYQMAKLFVYPSRYEGFGLPVIEAITSKVPVIAATGSCLEEAGGPNTLYVDPDNSLQLAEKIDQILSSPNQQKQMIEDGLKHIKLFAPSILSHSIMKLYQSTLQP